jgi:Flp pilus assembly protein CpaB
MKRRIGLIVLAIVLALVGTVAVYSYAHNADKRAVDATRSTNVLYANKQIPAGTTWGDAVKGDYFTQEKVPVDAAPSTAVADTAESIPADEVATGAIASGQIVVRQMFGAKTASTGILAIPKGKMAVSVTLPANADVAGFVQSGSQVAIYSTFKLNNAQGSTVPKGGATGGGTDVYATKMLLPRVDVIATSQDAPSDLNGGKSSTNNTSPSNLLVTMALSQADAERMILAQQIGQLYLALLSDSSVTAADGGVVNAAIFQPTPIFAK